MAISQPNLFIPYPHKCSLFFTPNNVKAKSYPKWLTAWFIEINFKMEYILEMKNKFPEEVSSGKCNIHICVKVYLC